MKNFKQIALGLIVGSMALGFSAFTNAKTNSTTYYYGLNKAGSTYTEQSTDPSGDCNNDSHLKDCSISYSTYQGASFSSGSIPAGGMVLSGPGWVNP
jgi:hypothetical protein